MNKLSKQCEPKDSSKYTVFFFALVVFSLSLVSMPTMAHKREGVAHGHPMLEAPAKYHHRKPGADVTVLNKGVQSINVGENKRFDLLLRATPSKGQAFVELKADSGLSVVGELQHTFDLAEGNQLHLPLTVRTSTEGQHFLHVFVRTLDSGGRASSRAMAVAFQTPKAKSLLRPSTKVSPGNVIHLPAKETIY